MPTTVLDTVKLNEFTASSTRTQPFQQVTLRWNASAPPNVRLILDGLLVDHVGSLDLHPFETRAFTLVATTGIARRDLGTVTVDVDSSRCGAVTPLTGLQRILGNGLSAYIKSPPVPREHKLEFRSDPGGGEPVVTIGDNAISFQMYLKQYTGGNSPDPDVDIDARFSVAVSPDGILTPAFSRLSIDVHFPAVVWLIPGAMIGLPIAIDGAREYAEREIKKNLGDTFRTVQNTYVPTGMRPTYARITTDEKGTLTIGYCPRPLQVLTPIVRLPLGTLPTSVVK